MALASNRCRVYIDHIDITSMVHRITIEAAVNHTVVTTLVLLGAPSVSSDGVMRFDVSGPTEGGNARAILIREDHE